MNGSNTFARPDGGATGGPQDVRPVVATARGSNFGLYAFLAILATGGDVLSSALSSSREPAQAPSVRQVQGGAGERIASPPPLEIPGRFAARPDPGLATLDSSLQNAERLQPRRPASPRGFAPPGAEPPRQPQSPSPLPAAFRPNSEQPRVVYENRPALPPARAFAGDGNRESQERVTAERFANPAFTVPQGTVIPAVLETALDSTRVGGARALVQRHVMSFDGTRLLIPRGSRLYGEYDASLQSGQNRALVRWTRLIRPDGVTIALDSPSSDPLGRAGIKGKVDSKFLQRFGGSILQSVLDLGVGVAVSRATDGVIVALPGSTQNVQVTDQQQVQPTLRVQQGTSVSVFVARDLDFSTVDR
jgi:type IV secretion system protein VirB10